MSESQQHLPEWWSRRFGDVLPLGFELRYAYRDRWFRIHSLPESKRYPETPEELGGLLARHAAVADEVLGAGAACWVVVPRYERSELGATRQFDEFPGEDFECVGWSVESDDEEELVTAFWACRMAWDAARVRPAMEAIADDRTRALWMCVDSGEVYAPYDGGADVIVADQAAAERAQRQFADWLSERADGL